jgi:molybdopterin/thiamine biosynthesis adenylyltransferase
VLPGIVGCLQGLEALKVILGLGDTLSGRLLTFDALDMTFREFKLRVDPANEVTYANRDRIQIVELEGLCMPHVTAAAS